MTSIAATQLNEAVNAIRHYACEIASDEIGPSDPDFAHHFATAAITYALAFAYFEPARFAALTEDGGMCHDRTDPDPACGLRIVAARVAVASDIPLPGGPP